MSKEPKCFDWSFFTASHVTVSTQNLADDLRISSVNEPGSKKSGLLLRCASSKKEYRALTLKNMRHWDRKKKIEGSGYSCRHNPPGWSESGSTRRFGFLGERSSWVRISARPWLRWTWRRWPRPPCVSPVAWSPSRTSHGCRSVRGGSHQQSETSPVAENEMKKKKVSRRINSRSSR